MNKQMIDKLKKLQKEMLEAQERIELSEFTGRATGVVVIMQGTRQVLDVKISKDLLEDIEILQEAILLAVNDALAQIENTTQETMGKYANPGIGF